MASARTRHARTRGLRRGAYALPSLFTMANMFCGYACIVYAMRGEYVTAAPYIGIAVVLDMLDGRIARMTGATSAFGVEFDSLADVISFGVAPAVLAFSWGLQSFGRLGWAAGFIYVAAAAIRLARFNIAVAAPHDRRYFIGLPSPAAAAVPAATVFAYPYGLQDWLATLALPMVLVPAFLMISTLRYRSFKTFDLRSPRSARKMIVLAVVMAAIAAVPQWSLVTLAYTYLISGFVEMAVWRIRRPAATAPDAGVPHSDPADTAPGLGSLPPAERSPQGPHAL